MSAIGQTDDAAGTELDELPQFELSFLFDDQDAPTEVTIFHPGADERAASRWITIDSRHAVPLDEIQ